MFDGEQLTLRSHSIDNRDGLYKKPHKKLHLECEEFLGLEHLDLSTTERVTIVGLRSPIDLAFLLAAPCLSVLEIKNSPGLAPTEANFKVLNQLQGVSVAITGCGREFVDAFAETDLELAGVRALAQLPMHLGRAFYGVPLSELSSRIAHASSSGLLEESHPPLHARTPRVDRDQFCPQPPDLTKRGG